jgi:hypothetical protein
MGHFITPIHKYLDLGAGLFMSKPLNVHVAGAIRPASGGNIGNTLLGKA